MKGLSGKTVIVTGGGGGIGRAVCLRFAAEGSLVAVLDRDEAAAQATLAAIEETGGKGGAYTADISDYASVTAAVAALEKALGIPQILVNNAGFDRFMPFLKTQPKQWEQLNCDQPYRRAEYAPCGAAEDARSRWRQGYQRGLRRGPRRLLRGSRICRV
jgi:NAD(P)-dependent dehydrogenase (short-subunit alcohol dehydrogenase family)